MERWRWGGLSAFLLFSCVLILNIIVKPTMLSFQMIKIKIDDDLPSFQMTLKTPRGKSLCRRSVFSFTMDEVTYRLLETHVTFKLL